MIREKFSISAPVKIIPSATHLAAKKCDPNGKAILYLGHLYPQKGTNVLIEALQFLPQRKLIIIGGNKAEDMIRIRTLSDRFGVGDRVEITGYLEPPLIETYLNQVGVGVIPILDLLETRLFTSPLKLFDYMAAKIPIVASDLPSIREVLTNGETGILVEANNPRKLAEGIQKVLSDHRLAQKISEQAYRKAHNFTWKKRSEQISLFLEQVSRK